MPRPDNGITPTWRDDMQDIVDKFDRAKELLELAGPGGNMTDAEQDAAAKELLGLGIDAIGEVVASARRIAVALETIAENTKPVELTAATAELVSGPGLAETISGIDWSHIGFIMGQGFANGDRSAR